MSGPHLDLTHCTRLVRLGIRVLAVILLAIAAAAPAARADGDPASDVLASQPLFVPQDAGLTGPQQAQLEALLAAGRRTGYDLHVAIVAGRSDLGSVGALWRAPQSYARFLGQEIALVAHGPLLVVMPNGYGYVRVAGTQSAGAAAVAGLPAPGSSLGLATIAAVRRVAAGAGHPLPTVAPATRAADSGGGEAPLAWGVFAAGALTVLVAWGLSLRARPVGRRRTAPG